MLSDRVDQWSKKLREEGEAKGRSEGEAKGRAEGEAKGRSEGLAEGMARLHEVAIRLLDNGMAVREVVELTGLSESEILSIRDVETS